MDPADFLKARLDGDEALAKAAEREMATWGGQRPSYAKLGFDVGDLAQTFSPARVLREVEAKHAILDEHAPTYPTTYPKPSGQPTCGVCHAGGWDWEPENWPCATIRALAAVYSGHPDYDPAWAPVTRTP